MCEKIFAFRIKHYFKLRREQTKARYVAKNGIFVCSENRNKRVEAVAVAWVGRGIQKYSINKINPYPIRGICVTLRRARYFRIEPNPLV